MQKIKSIKGKKPITALTCYDFPTAKILNEAGIDVLLVGDSLGMTVLGYESTHFVTLEDMIRHTQAVMRGGDEALVVADMPISSYVNTAQALANCRRLLNETSVRAVKLEGRPEIVSHLVQAGISVMGHTGLKPQEVSGYTIKGKDQLEAEQILNEAKEIENAGAFAIVLECIPESLGKKITESLQIPTIGIGAGRYTDGQILVLHDILGLSFGVHPRFARKYIDLKEQIKKAVLDFKEDVEEKRYPSSGEVYR